jgi:Mn2+/Fe2+ NRAMP family transporter
MIILAKCTVILFGVFLIAAGFLMLFAPGKANQLLRKAGSSNLINYTEITIRMIPAAALILASDISKFPDIFRLLGWFMIFTSLVLYFVPRRLHHQYAVICADILKPIYFRLVSPLSMLFGAALIYSVI